MSPDTPDTSESGVAPLDHTKPDYREKRYRLTGVLEVFVRTGSITLRPSVRERQACGRDATAGHALDALVDAALKVSKPFIAQAQPEGDGDGRVLLGRLRRARR